MHAYTSTAIYGDCYKYPNGTIIGSCSNPTPPTPSPTPGSASVPWSGSDLASDVRGASDGAEFWLGAVTITWASDVACNKAVTVVGAGKGVTVLDAGNARRFFSMESGCALTLKHLSLHNGAGRPHNGKASGYGGAIKAASGSTLYATSVEFKDNSAKLVLGPYGDVQNL